jgi:hypothetical protein
MGEEVKMHTGFWWGNLKTRGQLEDTGVHEISIKMGFKNKTKGCGLASLAQDRDRWRALGNTAMNPLVSCSVGNFLIDEELLASQN